MARGPYIIVIRWWPHRSAPSAQQLQDFPSFHISWCFVFSFTAPLHSSLPSSFLSPLRSISAFCCSLCFGLVFFVMLMTQEKKKNTPKNPEILAGSYTLKENSDYFSSVFSPQMLLPYPNPPSPPLPTFFPLSISLSLVPQTLLGNPTKWNSSANWTQ